MPDALSESMWIGVASDARSARAMYSPLALRSAPTSAMMPRFRSIETSPSARRSGSNVSSRSLSSIVTDTDTSEVATTSTETLWR
jgi:hypothetical protein